MPTIVTILILAALWLAVLAPSWLRRLSRYQNERRFHSWSASAVVPSWQSPVVPLTGVVQLTPPPRSALVPPGVGVERLQREKARLRRRNILLALAGLALITFVGALSGAAVWILVHVLVDILLVGYVGALARRQRRILERQAKVTDIASARNAAYAGGPGVGTQPAEEAFGTVGSIVSGN